MFKVLYLYIVECSDNTFYIGVTNNLERRLEEHNSGFKRDAYTYSRRPVILVFYEIFNDFELAFLTETKLKKWSHGKKQALIDGDEKLLKALAKKDFSKRES